MDLGIYLQKNSYVLGNRTSQLLKIQIKKIIIIINFSEIEYFNMLFAADFILRKNCTYCELAVSFIQKQYLLFISTNNTCI